MEYVTNKSCISIQSDDIEGKKKADNIWKRKKKHIVRNSRESAMVDNYSYTRTDSEKGNTI